MYLSKTNLDIWQMSVDPDQMPQSYITCPRIWTSPLVRFFVCWIKGWSQDCSKSDGCFSQYFISSPWRRYEDYNISFCKQWKFRCHCSYEQWSNGTFCIVYKGVKVAPKQGFQKSVWVTTVLHSTLVLSKLDIWNECRPWSDATICGIWSGSRCLVRHVCSNL